MRPKNFIKHLTVRIINYDKYDPWGAVTQINTTFAIKQSLCAVKMLSIDKT